MSQDSVNAENEPREGTEGPSLESSADGGAEFVEMAGAGAVEGSQDAGPVADALNDGVGADDDGSDDDDVDDGDDVDGDGDSGELNQFDGDTNDNVKPIEEAGAGEESEEVEKNWYILKVQSNREKSICAALVRRVKIEGLDEYFGEIIVPTEDVAEFKNGKRRVIKRKLYPGYIVVNMTLNEETWFVVRETPGIGDFTGSAGKPSPMLTEEIDRIVKAAHPEEDDAEQIKTAIPFNLGDRVRIKEGTFENFEGDVDVIDDAGGRVTIVINIFNRSTPVELEHWQIEAI